MLLGSSGRARADGALPLSQGILLPADRAQEIVLATNIGLMLSEDGGATWLWTCEQQGATTGGYLYSVGPAPRDRFYALSPDQGLSYSDDGSCNWHRAGGALSANIASDYFVDPSNGDRVLAVAATRDDAGNVNPPAVYASADAGATFGDTPLWSAPQQGNIVGVEIARSDGNRVYLATYTITEGTVGVHPALITSTDGGQTWTSRDVTAALGTNQFRILAVDSANPDVLYLRVIASGMEQVAVTRDAGATFTTSLTVSGGTLSAFARLTSGTVLVGGLIMLSGGGTSGVAYRSADGGASFQPWDVNPSVAVNMKHLLGLGERGGVVYLAGKNVSDPWTLASSTDDGTTTHVLMTGYDQVSGIKPCAQQSCAGACLSQEMINPVFSADVCSGPADGGGGGSAGGGSPGGGGCHCVVSPEGRGGGRRGAVAVALTLALLGAAALAARRGARRGARRRA